MKKLLLSFLLIAAALVTQAQGAKPTKEQTIEYILNTLENHNVSIDFPKSSDGTQFNDKIKVEDIAFDDCVVTLKEIHYEKRYFNGAYNGFNDYNNVYNINLKDIEKVELTNDNVFKWRITFYCFNGKKLIKNDYEYTNEENKKETTSSSISSCTVTAPRDDKLVQAFNHLRKLWGAPEPIKF